MTADVTDGGGSADFLLKIYVPGQAGPPQQLDYSSGTGWTNRGDPTGGVLAQAPAIMTYNGNFYVFVLGQDQNIWQTYWDASVGVWEPWSQVSGPQPSGSYPFTSAPSATVFSGSPVVFVRGSNNHIWQNSWSPGSGWTGWADISTPYSSVSAPAVMVYTGNNDRNELQLWWLDSAGNNMMQMIYNRYGGPANAWTGPWVGACCYESAPAVAQYNNTFQLWAVGQDARLYQRVWSPGTGWGPYATITNDLVGSAASLTQYGAQFQVFYVMGDYQNTWETKQLVYDPNAGGWQAAADVADLQSAPAIAQYGPYLQVWDRDTSDPIHRTQPNTNDCPHGGNYGDTACIGGGGATYLGASAYWDNKSLSFKAPAVNGDHINNHLWFYTSNGQSFIEMGLDYGGCIVVPGISCYNWPSTCQPCSELMWDDHDPSDNQYDHYISSPPQDGSVNQYQIQRDSSNPQYWDIYYDGGLPRDVEGHGKLDRVRSPGWPGSFK
jgi:hypothetical protein